MPLEIRHNRAEHTHENEQFRRVATSMGEAFNEHNWTGLLIGNPFNDTYSRFRADAILLYNNGLVIIDFKDYSGIVQLPLGEEQFQFTPWYNENLYDNQRIAIKAGARFVNPFMQLKHYREAMYEIIETTSSLATQVDKTRTCAANIFSGPIEIINRVPGKFRYYKILQEAPSSLQNFLYDYSSPNSYSAESAETLKTIFPAPLWLAERLIRQPEKEPEPSPVELHHPPKPAPLSSEQPKEEQPFEIEARVKEKLSNFLNQDSSGILVLESMQAAERDVWMQHILNSTNSHRIPQVEIWSYSSRIARQINTRTGILPYSLFATIYGGEERILQKDELPDTTEIKRVIPIRSSTLLDEKAVVILHEAHLVDSSLIDFGEDSLTFGSGRLLDDLLTFLALSSTGRKLICIGDPYSLTYGKYDNCALNKSKLEELHQGELDFLRQQIPVNHDNCLDFLQAELAGGIENGIFNSLTYNFDGTVAELQRQEALQCIKGWFSQPLSNEPNKAILTYTNELANRISSWIKADCLNNGRELATNDLLLVNNHVSIADVTGFGNSTDIHNGMYLLVKEVRELQTITLSQKEEQPVELNYIHIKAVVLSHPDTMEINLWLLSNCLQNPHGRPLEEEERALKILLNMKIQEEKKKNPFEMSPYHTSLHQNTEYTELKIRENDLEQRLSSNERCKTKLEEVRRNIRELERRFSRYHTQKIRQTVHENDPLINAVHARYGWAITVNKAIGSRFDETLIMAKMGDDKPAYNSTYFRWLYTALSATVSKAWIFEPQTVHPLIKCVYEDTSASPMSSVIPKTPKFTYTAKNRDQIFPAPIDTVENIHVQSILADLAGPLNKAGYRLDTVQSHGEYLTKAFITRQNCTGEQSVLAVHNKGGKDNFAVSSLRVEKSWDQQAEEELNVIVEAIITHSSAAVFEGESGELPFPDDFRQEVYLFWQKMFKKMGLTLHLVKKHNFQDVFHVVKENPICKFRVYYDGKGFITRLTAIEFEDQSFGPTLKEVLMFPPGDARL